MSTASKLISKKTKSKNAEVFAQYQKIVEDLVAKVAQQRQENEELEEKIRNEVCGSYEEMLLDMKRRYSNDKREAIEDIEHLTESRLNLYKEYVLDGKDLESQTLDSQDLDEVSRKRLTIGCDSVSKSSLENDTTRFEKEIEYLKKQILVKEREINDLNELLDEAAQQFQKMELEQEELTASLKELKMTKETQTRGIQFPSPTTNDPKRSHLRRWIPPVTVRDQSTSMDFVIQSLGSVDDAVPCFILRFEPTGLIDDRSIDTADGPDHKILKKKRRSSKRGKKLSLSISAVRIAQKRLPAFGRKRFDEVVKLNRAYVLKSCASPTILHNHITGITYEVKPLRNTPVRAK